MFDADPFHIWRNIGTIITHSLVDISEFCIVLASVYVLKTIEIILIPASDIPVKNLMMTNIIYDGEIALRTANIMEDKYDTSSSRRRPNLVTNTLKTMITTFWTFLFSM